MLQAPSSRIAEQDMPFRGIDVLRWPVLGRFLRWRRARTTVQVILLAVTALVVLNGFAGPALAPRNLGSVLTWIHYRGLLIVALLVAGNVFCMGCPFVLVRDAARRLHAPRRTWPALLRSKWTGIALLVLVLFVYELFDLWAQPQGTAWLVLAYFAGAVAVDVVFTGAGFCKYVCPIGQFNFAASTMSPLELQVRDGATCQSCTTVDCIRGRREPGRPEHVVQRGCELHLFLPAKAGNMDCTFCLDCVQACPHENIALGARAPASELVDDRSRSSIGRPSRRWDLAALAVVFTFGALLNAFAMTAPVHTLEQWISATLGVTSEGPVLVLIFAGALVAAPLVLLGAAAFATAAVTRRASPGMRAEAPSAGLTFRRFAVSLIPVGFALWTAHYGFHLLTGALTIVPVSQSAAADLAGRAVLGEPRWTWVGMQSGSVLPLQLGVVVLGAFGSIVLAYLIAEREHQPSARLAALPWVAVSVLLAAAAVWVFLQPMEMRGTSLAG
jgi:ferredoxin